MLLAKLPVLLPRSPAGSGSGSAWAAECRLAVVLGFQRGQPEPPVPAALAAAASALLRCSRLPRGIISHCCVLDNKLLLVRPLAVRPWVGSKGGRPLLGVLAERWRQQEDGEAACGPGAAANILHVLLSDMAARLPLLSGVGEPRPTATSASKPRKRPTRRYRVIRSSKAFSQPCAERHRGMATRCRDLSS